MTAAVRQPERERRLAGALAEVTNRLEVHFGCPEPERRSSGDLLGSLIHTILSQNTNDRNSGRAYRRLRECFPTYAEMHRAPAEEIGRCIRVAGLYRQKSVRILQLLDWAKRRFGGYDLREICSWPVEQAMAELTALKGVGPKTAAVVLLFRCGKDVFPVDTHVHKILRRLGLVPERAAAEQTFRLVNPLVPPGKSLSLHVNLLKLGRTLCLARSPRCEACPLLPLCDFARRRLGEQRKDTRPQQPGGPAKAGQKGKVEA